MRKFEEAVHKIPEEIECYLMTATTTTPSESSSPTPPTSERLHSKHLTRLPGVAGVHSSFALRTVQGARELPIR